MERYQISASSEEELMPAARQRSKKKAPTQDQAHRITFDEPMVGPGVLRLEEKLLAEMERIHSPAVLLDLTQVRRIDSKGISLCVGLFKELQKKDVAFSIEASPEIADSFRMVKLDRIIPTKETAK